MASRCIPDISGEITALIRCQKSGVICDIVFLFFLALFLPQLNFPVGFFVLVVGVIKVVLSMRV